MSDLSVDLIKSTLSNYTLPYLETDPVTANTIKDISITDELVKIDMQFGIPVIGINRDIAEQISDTLKYQTPATDVLVKMFQKVSVTVLGVIENMSTHICTQCGHEETIFGSGGGEHMAEVYDVPLPAQLPLDLQIREGVDSGHLSMMSDPESTGIANNPRNYGCKLPIIVIENKQ